MLKTLSVILGFQLVWFSCALGIAQNNGFLPLVTSILYILFIFLTTSAKKPFSYFVGSTVLLGFLVDTALLQGTWVVFKEPNLHPLENLQPWWMALLWAAFAASFPISFSWMKKKYVLAATLGAIFGPLSYFSGAKLGAIEPISFLGLVFVGLLWCMAMPVVLRLSFHFVNFD